jgi:hypothetical protein
MPDQSPAEEVLDWKQIGELIAVGVAAGVPGDQLAKAFISAKIQSVGGVQALAWRTLEETALLAGTGLHKLEEPFLPIIAAFVAPILGGLFGAEINESDFRRKLSKGEGNRGAQAIMEGFMKAIVGDTPAEIQPSDAGAKRVAAAAVQASLESTFNAYVPEILSHLLPFDIGHFEHLAELPENIIRSLGVSRLVRRAIQPIVTVCCTTPATWHMNKLHRPTLLGAGALARQIARHPEQKEKWLEDLRREGYSEARIEALLNEQAKFHSVADLSVLIRSGQWTRSAAVSHLRDQGYAEDVAGVELDIERLKLIGSFERSMATAAVTAFADGRIEEAELGGFVNGATIDSQERAQFVELAHARRALGRKPLSPGEAEQCVKAKILSLSDYRDALRRDGRTEDAITALDLLLRWEMDKDTAIETHRKQQEAERALEKAARLEAARVRALELAAAAALKRRGSEADLEAAAIRGLIPLTRVQEIYSAKYDGATVAIYMDLLAAKRQDYIGNQTAVAAAKQKAAARGVDVPALERAVTAGVLTTSEMTTRLQQLGFDPADAALLVNTLTAQLQATADAKDARDQAAAAAKIRQLNLGQFETLVRRGHKTMADYEQFLETIGIEEASRAALLDLLQIKIDDDVAARTARAAADARLASKGLSLEQFRRGVLLGVKTDAEFQRFMVDNGFTADAQIVLLAHLRADVAEGEAARQRRIDAAEGVGSLRAPLSDVARAARLGIVTVATYTARLVELGYTDDDVALETDLLVEEMASVQAARQARADAEAATPERGLSLAQTAQLVRTGRSSIDLYRDAARGLGYTAEAADALATLLQDELAADVTAERRRAAIAADAGVKHVSLGQLEAGVLAGLRSFDDYAAAVRDLGYGEDDAELLAGLLATRLERFGAGPTRQAALDQEDVVRSYERQTVAASVLAGERTPDDYAAWLTSRGYAPDDVVTLVDLVLVALVKPPKAQP